MRRFSRKHGVHVRALSKECVRTLTAHQWPGNVRELQNVIERAVILCPDGEDLRTEHLGFTTATLPLVSAAPANGYATPELTLPELEKLHILATLERCGGNRTHASKRLGIAVRTLRNKLHEFGITSTTAVDDDEDLKVKK